MTKITPGKLVEVDHTSHAALEKYCQEQGHDMRTFLSGLIVGEVKRLAAEKAAKR